MMSLRYRLAIVASHPIQYQAPLFRALGASEEIDPTVFFCSNAGARTYYDAGFGRTVRWDVPLLDGYRHRFLPNVSPTRGTGRFWGVFNPRLVGHLLRGRFDAMLIHGWGLSTYWLAIEAARAMRIPIFLRAESNGLSEPTGAKAAVKRAMLGHIFAGSAGFMAIGTLNRKFYQKYGVEPERVFPAPYSVDNSFFARHAEELCPRREELRGQAGIPSGAVVFLFCGKLSAVKRPLDVLEAFARVPHPSKYLVLAGDGVLRGEIEAKARELGLSNTLITGFCNQTELPRWYAVADALVLPSGFEPWGLVVNEAMNFSLPIIASDGVGSAPDLVEPGGNGFVYPRGDVDALARSMEQVATDGALRAAMGARSRQIIDGWGIAQTVEGYERALHQVLGPRAGV